MDSRGDNLLTGPWVLALALSLPKLLPDQKCSKQEHARQTSKMTSIWNIAQAHEELNTKHCHQNSRNENKNMLPGRPGRSEHSCELLIGL